MRQRLINVNDVQLRVTEAGDQDAPAVILAHGFPSLSYSWRRVMPAM